MEHPHPLLPLAPLLLPRLPLQRGVCQSFFSFFSDRQDAAKSDDRQIGDECQEVSPAVRVKKSKSLAPVLTGGLISLLEN